MKTQLLIILLSFAISGNAQITLNSSNLFNTGDRIINGVAYFTLSPNIVPGNPGAAQSWNFTTNTFDTYDTTDIYAPGWLAPAYTSQCPQTTHVMGSGTNAMNFDFILADASGFYIIGNSSYNPNFGVQTSVYQNYVDWMHWPATYGQNYVDTVFADNTQAVSGGSSDSVRTIVGINFTSNIDAWGTMTITSGTYNVLRLKRVLHYDFTTMDHDSIMGWQAPVYSTYDATMYEWWTDSPGIGYPIATIYMDQQDSSVQQYYILQASVSGTAEEMNPKPNLRIYPSPSSTSISVQTEIKSGTWQITDLSGRIVQAGVVNTNITTINISDLNSGIYFLNVTDTNGDTVAEKFVKE